MSATFVVQALKALAEMIKYSYPPVDLQGTAARLSYLTFNEAFLFRTGLVASMIVILVYGVIHLCLHVTNLASA